MHNLFHLEKRISSSESKIIKLIQDRISHLGQKVSFKYQNKFYSDSSLSSRILNANSLLFIENENHYFIDNFNWQTALKFSYAKKSIRLVLTKLPKFNNILTEWTYFQAIKLYCEQVICNDKDLVAKLKRWNISNILFINDTTFSPNERIVRRELLLSLQLENGTKNVAIEGNLDNRIELFEYIRLAKNYTSVQFNLFFDNEKSMVEEFISETSLPRNIKIFTCRNDFDIELFSSILYLDLSLQGNKKTHRSCLKAIMNGVPIITTPDSISYDLVFHHFNGIILKNHSMKAAKQAISLFIENDIMFEYFQKNASDRAIQPMQYEVSPNFEIFEMA